jgi:sigma-B regulation protein RsbU (phosphoserine phosphatase)
VQAAILTALIRHTLRAVVVGLHAPSQALSALNQVLLQHDTDRFCTVALVRMQRGPGGWVATVGTGGHPRPLLVRVGGRPTEVGGPGPLVGVRADPTFLDERAELEAGDTLLMYTDGITESRGHGDYYGEDRLHQSLLSSGGSARTIVEAVVDDVITFSDGPPRDDIAVLALRVPEEP